MPSPTTLASGLGGAIGCHFREDTNQLFFVEFNTGRISRLDLIRPAAAVVSSGTAILKGTWLFDLDTGTQGSSPAPVEDIWWQQQTAVQRRMTPRNGAEIALAGMTSFASVTPVVLQGLSYGSTPINGSNNASNQLPTGTVFAVRTTAGNYAKVEVLEYGYDMRIRWITYRLESGYTVIGTGYNRPQDIVLSSDGVHAYVTERTGALLRVRLSSANRPAAAAVTSGMSLPHQISLDEAHGHAYVVEFGSSRRLFRVNLSDGSKTAIAAGLNQAAGLAMSGDSQFAYVSLQEPGAHRVERIEISSGHRETVAAGLQNPFYLTWSGPGESAILVAERDPANRVRSIDLTQSPPALRPAASGLPARPSSAAMVSATRMLVCSDSVISSVDLAADLFSAAGPLLLGVGHVPKDRISQSGVAAVRGYADTTGDAGYFFQVKDAPFGGVLPIQFNHTRAYAEGARFYRLWAGSAEPLQTWHDFRWIPSANRFELQSISPMAGGYYAIRAPSQIWFNHWLGYRLNTLGLPDGLHNIRVRTYQQRNESTQVSTEAFWVRVDNQAPTASIEEIIHHLAPSGTRVVGACGIVNTPTDRFRFRITAHDPAGHLKSWRLITMWGENRSREAASQAYTPAADKKWHGINAALVPPSPWSAAVPGDPTSTNCAHTFHLTVWDRAINGHQHIHRSTYHKSITIMIP